MVSQEEEATLVVSQQEEAMEAIRAMGDSSLVLVTLEVLPAQDSQVIRWEVTQEHIHSHNRWVIQEEDIQVLHQE